MTKPQNWNIEIPEPCAEDFDAMPRKGDRLMCAQCSRAVIDFRGKSKKEIADILLRENGPCGVYHAYQMQYVWEVEERSPWYSRPLVAAAALAAALLPGILHAQSGPKAGTKTKAQRSVQAPQKVAKPKSATPKFISGQVADTNGLALAGATVYLQGYMNQQVISDSAGRFRLPVPANTNNSSQLTLTIIHDDYKRYTKAIPWKAADLGKLTLKPSVPIKHEVTIRIDPDRLRPHGGIPPRQHFFDEPVSYFSYRTNKEGNLVKRSRAGRVLYSMKYYMIVKPVRFAKGLFRGE